MNPNRINLLPSERVRLLVRDYFYRLGIVFCILFFFLVVVSALLLIPTYVFLSYTQSAKEATLTSAQSALSSTNGDTVSARLSALSTKLAVLDTLQKGSSASVVIRSVLAVGRPGITLSGISYTRENGAKPASVVVAGTAATRDTLRNYQIALQGAAFAKTVDLPVSAYAKDTHISFTLTITLAP